MPLVCATKDSFTLSLVLLPNWVAEGSQVFKVKFESGRQWSSKRILCEKPVLAVWVNHGLHQHLKSNINLP